MMLNTKAIHNPFWRNFPARAKQMPSKVSYVSKKKWRHFEFAYFSFFLTHLELKRKLRSYTSVVPSKTIPDSRPKWAKCIFVFRPKRRKNPTRWGGTYVAYIRESPPPPAPHPGLLLVQIWIPTSVWSLRMTECQPTEILSFPPHMYRAYAYPPHYSHLPFPFTSLNRGTVLSRLKDTIKAEISRPEIQKRLDNRNESKAQGIPLGEFEHNSMAIRSSFEIFHLVKNRFSHLKAIFYRINLKNLCLIGKFMVQR